MQKPHQNPLQPLHYALYSTHGVILTLSLHFLALVFGLWPLFNLYVWSFFYSSFYGTSGAVFLSVCSFLCLQSIIHSIFDGVLQAFTNILAYQHAASLQEQILENVKGNISRVSSIKNFNQSFLDTETYFKSLYGVSTNVLLQIGNLVGNFFNLYRVGLFQTAGLFYASVLILDYCVKTSFRDGGNGLPKIIKKLNNMLSGIRDSIKFISSQSIFLTQNTNKINWLIFNLQERNYTTHQTATHKNFLSLQVDFIQKVLNKLIYPLMAICIVFIYGIPFPLVFDKRFPLQLFHIGAFVQVLESFRQIYTNGSFYYKNSKNIDLFQASSENLQQIFDKWGKHFHLPTCNTSISIQYFSIIIARNIYFGLLTVAAIGLFNQQARNAQIMLPSIFSLGNIQLFSILATLILCCILEVRYRTLLPEKSSKNAIQYIFDALFHKCWGHTLFSIFSSYYCFFTLCLNAPSYLFTFSTFLSLIVITSLFGLLLDKYLMGLIQRKYPKSKQGIIKPSDSTSLDIYRLSRYKTSAMSEISLNLNNPLKLRFGSSILLRGTSGIGKSSLFIQSLLQYENLPENIHALISFPQCKKIFFSQTEYPALESLDHAGQDKVGLYSGKTVHTLSPLEHYFLSYVCAHPHVCHQEIKSVLDVWSKSLHAKFIEFLQEVGVPDKELLKIREGSLPNSPAKESKILISCAAIYCCLLLPHHLPHQKLLIVIDEGVDDLSETLRQQIASHFLNAVHQSNGGSLILSVSHTMPDRLIQTCYDASIVLTPHAINPKQVDVCMMMHKT
ncbi:MAG: hypothetical protein VX112_01270 [Pseudomonadota bacterium]|nr:hypothetical protein [Pseudomonadota bacterium]